MTVDDHVHRLLETFDLTMGSTLAYAHTHYRMPLFLLEKTTLPFTRIIVIENVKERLQPMHVPHRTMQGSNMD